MIVVMLVKWCFGDNDEDNADNFLHSCNDDEKNNDCDEKCDGEGDNDDENNVGGNYVDFRTGTCSDDDDDEDEITTTIITTTTTTITIIIIIRRRRIVNQITMTVTIIVTMVSVLI